MAGSFTVSVRSDIRQAVGRLEAKAQKAVNLAARRALNRTLTSARKEASKQIRQEYNLKSATIKAQFRFVRPDSRRLVAELVASGKRIPLIEFSARQTARGVTAKITRQRRRYAHAFIATMPYTGHRGVFMRKGSARLPIKHLVGISTPKAFEQPKIIGPVSKIAARRFKIEFERELKYRLGI